MKYKAVIEVELKTNKKLNTEQALNRIYYILFSDLVSIHDDKDEVEITKIEKILD
jgi:flagellin-specific chaperone FliS